MPQSQAAALPIHQEEEETDKTKTSANRPNVLKSTTIRSLFPRRDNRNAKRTEEHKNKITQGKTQNKSPHRINHKATMSKTNTGTRTVSRINHGGWGWEGEGGLKHFYSRPTSTWIPMQLPGLARAHQHELLSSFVCLIIAVKGSFLLKYIYLNTCCK